MIARMMLILLSVTFIPSVVFAKPWPNQIFVSPGGEYYVVMKRVGKRFFDPWGPVYYQICKAGEDLPRIELAQTRVMEFAIDFLNPGGYRYGVDSDPNVAKRKGDARIGFGVLMRPPAEILISDEGLGFAGIGVFGTHDEIRDPKPEHEYACIIVASNGAVLHRHSLADLFSKEEQSLFRREGDVIHWRNETSSGWIDHANRRLVIVSTSTRDNPKKYLVRLVDWKSGNITHGPDLASQDEIEALRLEHQGETKPNSSKKK